MKFHVKILLIFLTLTVILGTSMLWTVKSAVHQILVQDAVRAGVSRAAELAYTALPGFQEQSEHRLLPDLQIAKSQTDALYAMALGPTGLVFAHTNVTEKGTIYNDPVTLKGLRSEVPTHHVSEFYRESVLDVFVPVWITPKANAAEEFLIGGGQEAPKRVRLGTVRLGIPLKEILQTQYRLYRKIAAILIVAGVIGLVVIMLFLRHMLLPIKYLSEATSRISQGEYDRDVPVFSKDELGGLARDFNRMRRALTETTVSKDYLSGVLDNLADPLIVTSAETIIRDVNPAALKLLGYTKTELVGKPLQFLCPVGSPLQVFENANALMHSTLRNIELLFKTSKGETVPILLSSSAVKDASGAVADIIVIAKDMTDRKRLESIVRQSDKMSAVGQLAAGVAHEINNPLGVILGFAETIEHDLKPADPLSEPMKVVIRETLRCKTLVQNLLSFSRERKPGMRPEDPRGVVQNALALVETQARVKNIKVERRFIEPLAPTLMDRNQMEQVLINLCTNAIDAMPKGGTITVTLAQKNSALEILITDTGMGMSADVLQKIFEPFFTTKEIGKGTGLGLSLAYEAVKKHHGTIDVQSEVGKGTTFTVRLPWGSGGAEDLLHE